MREWIVWLSLMVTLLFTTSACGSTDGVENGGTNAPKTHYTFYQDTPDGRVLCVWAKSGYGGGLSCDWAGAK